MLEPAENLACQLRALNLELRTAEPDRIPLFNVLSSQLSVLTLSASS
jgi:hypothetical protein